MRRLVFALALVGCDRSDPAPAAMTSDAPVRASAASPTTSASATPEAPRRTNVILITIDSLRADRMPWHGYRHEVAPTIAAFAKTAVNYTRFYSLSSYTSMTFGGFLAARYPSEVPRSGYFFSSIPSEVETFPEVLQQAGVRTMAGHAHWYFGKDDVGLDQGFDDWDLVPGLKKSNTTDNNVTSPAHVDLAMRQLGAVGDKPFFAWYHLMDPHDMYIGHQGTPSFGKGAAASYDGEIHFTDQHLKRLLTFIDEQPWADRTAVMISADHGETFGEHKMYRHGFELWQELTWVPLMVRLPGAASKTIDTPRGGVDLPVTILDLLGAKRPQNAQGVSLVPELRGEVEPEERAVIIDLPRTSDNDRRRALIWGRHKLIAHSDDEYFKLYDIVADPREHNDLATKDKKLFAEMRKRYEEASRRIKDVCPTIKKLKGKKKNRPC